MKEGSSYLKILQQKNLLKIALTICLFIAFSFANQSLAYATNPKFGTYPTPTQVGNCFYIYEPQHLMQIANTVNSGEDDFYDCKIYLMNNLNFKDTEFVPIGDAEHAFNGVFYGNGYCIDHINSRLCNKSHSGLFGYIGKYGVVRDLTIGGHSHFFGSDFIGGIAGINQGQIIHCCSRANIHSTSHATGGLIGYNAASGYACDCRVSKYAKIFCDDDAYIFFEEIIGENLGFFDDCKFFSKYPW